MYKTLLTKFSSLELSYTNGLNVINEIFNSLKKNDIKSLPSYTSSQLEYMSLIKQQKEELRESVREIAAKYGVNSVEYRLKDILFLFNQIEKESLIDIARRITRLEAEMQRALHRNQDFLASIMSGTEAILDSASDYSEHEYQDSQLFLDERF